MCISYVYTRNLIGPLDRDVPYQWSGIRQWRLRQQRSDSPGSAWLGQEQTLLPAQQKTPGKVHTSEFASIIYELKYKELLLKKELNNRGTVKECN